MSDREEVDTDLIALLLETETVVEGDVAKEARTFCKDLLFVPDCKKGGVKLSRSGITNYAVLVDDPTRGLPALLAGVSDWCAREALDPASDSVRLVVAALLSCGLPWWRRWRIAFIIAATAESRTRRGLLDEESVARSYAPRATRMWWYLLRKALLDAELQPTAESLLPDRLAETARAARSAWLDYLLHYEDYPLIAGIQPEREGERLLDVDLREVLPAGRSERLTAPHPIDRGERAFRSLLARELFARRFDLRGVCNTLPSDLPTRGVAWAVAMLLGLAPLSVIVAWLVTGWDAPPGVVSDGVSFLLGGGLVAGLAGYAVLVGSVPARSERLTYPFLLRLAASVVVGTVVVASLNQRWLGQIATQEPPGWMAIWITGGALAAACAYLLVEARLHGSHGWQAARRAAVVALIGVAHATFAALVLLVVADPVLELAATHAPGDTGRLRMVTVVAATALAGGVFLQILWEDRPVTYPLGVLRYRR